MAKALTANESKPIKKVDGLMVKIFYEHKEEIKKRFIDKTRDTLFISKFRYRPPEPLTTEDTHT